MIAVAEKRRSAIREVGCQRPLKWALAGGICWPEIRFSESHKPPVSAVYVSGAMAAAGYGGIGPLALFCLHWLTGQFGEPDNNLKGDI